MRHVMLLAPNGARVMTNDARRVVTVEGLVEAELEAALEAPAS